MKYLKNPPADIQKLCVWYEALANKHPELFQQLQGVLDELQQGIEDDEMNGGEGEFISPYRRKLLSALCMDIQGFVSRGKGEISLFQCL